MAVDSTKNTLYISQRAANAIIADVAPYRISSEALLAINTFLDEFLYFLVDSAKSLDLIRIKLAISQVLPTSLGKNAILEAELELKTYVESGNSDRTKEKTIEITPFPLQKVFEQFRVKCQFFSTLGERGADDRDLGSVPDLYASEGIHIAPSLAIYLTAALEYVGEYILILVARASEKQGVEVARAQEVYTALSEDSQILPLFRRTNLKEQMESRRENTSNNNKSSLSQLPTRISSETSAKSPKTGYMKSLSPTKSSLHNGTIGGGRQTSLDGFGSDWKKGPTSPVKSPSDYSRQSSEHKNVGMRSTKSMQSLQGQGGDKESDLRSVSSMEDSIEKMRSFETLISSNQTMKVSLTPNRLITIETHKRPPKLAPREPVSRERIIQKTSPTSPSDESDVDDDDELIFGKRKPKKGREETMWEFLKNTSPDDILGDKVRKKDSKLDLSRRRGKTIDKLESVPERSNPPGSPGNNPRYTPLIPSAKSSPSSPYQSDRINATIDKSLSSSRASNDQSRNYITSPTSSTYLPPSLHHSKSLDQTQSNWHYQHSQASKSSGHIQNSAKSTSIDDDDIFYPEGQKKPKRRHENQDLIDFLSSSPPKDSVFNNNGVLDTGNAGKKKEKKLKKILSKLIKSSSTDEFTSSQRPSSASMNSFSTTNTYASNSTANTLVNKPAKYVKIEIPKIPPKEENQEQSIFDQVEIQGRHARQVSRASLTGSTRSLQYTPNRSTFSSTGGMTSPTILEEKPDNNTVDSKKPQKPTNKSNIQQHTTNSSTLSQSNTNNTSTYPAHKISVSPSRQKSHNNNIANDNNNNKSSSQEMNKVAPALPKEQKLDISETLSKPSNSAVKSSSTDKGKFQHIPAKGLQSYIPPKELPLTDNKNIINENEKTEEVQTKREKAASSKEFAQNKVVQTKSDKVPFKEPAQNKGVQTKHDNVTSSKEYAQHAQNRIVQTKSDEVSFKEPAQNKGVQTKHDKVTSSKEYAQHAQNRIVQTKSDEVSFKEPAQNKGVQMKHDKVTSSKEHAKHAQNRIVQTKSDEVSSKEPAQNKEVQTKQDKVASSKEHTQHTQNEVVVQTKYEVSSKVPAQNKVVQSKSEVMISKGSVHNEIIPHDGFLASMIEAETEISVQDVHEIIMTYSEEEELEEAFVVEWLLGTSLTFKNAITYVDIMQVYEDDDVPEMEKSEYEDADDTEFIDDRDNEHIDTGTGRGSIIDNVVQVGVI